MLSSELHIEYIGPLSKRRRQASSSSVARVEEAPATIAAPVQALVQSVGMVEGNLPTALDTAFVIMMGVGR